jgi:nucleoside-diphosphate-sugar epimerase
MRSEDLILVTGATGNTGSTLLQELETRHARVRAMVREQPDGGRLRGTSASVVAGNFNDPRSLEASIPAGSSAKNPLESTIYPFSSVAQAL